MNGYQWIALGIVIFYVLTQIKVDLKGKTVSGCTALAVTGTIALLWLFAGGSIVYGAGLL